MNTVFQEHLFANSCFVLLNASSSIQFSDRQPIRKHSNFKADDSNTNVTGSYPPSNKKSLITPTIRKTFNNDEQSQESFKTNPRNEMILKQENM